MLINGTPNKQTTVEATLVLAEAGLRNGVPDSPMISLADPLEHDRADDPVVLLTHREVSRLLFVAAETGARFERDQLPYDPAAWMCTPRQLFGGANAATACISLDMFVRALVLHGATGDLDMDPRDMDLLLSDEDEQDVLEHPTAGCSKAGAAERPLALVKSATLFTATAVDHSASGHAHVFYATIASGPDEARDQLRARAGGRIAFVADVEAGFDATEPVAMSLLSEAQVDLLEQIAVAPSSPLSAGFKLFVEHRFDN